MAKATGIGGIFFRASDTKALSAWYETHLGVANFWDQQAGMTVFAPFAADTDYFPAGKQWMINFRVDDIDALQPDLGLLVAVIQQRHSVAVVDLDHFALDDEFDSIAGDDRTLLP